MCDRELLKAECDCKLLTAGCDSQMILMESLVRLRGTESWV